MQGIFVKRKKNKNNIYTVPLSAFAAHRHSCPKCFSLMKGVGGETAERKRRQYKGTAAERILRIMYSRILRAVLSIILRLVIANHPDRMSVR